MGRKYVDATNDITCPIDRERCVPQYPQPLLGQPVVGHEVLVRSYDAQQIGWAANNEESLFARVDRGHYGGRVEPRRVLSVLLVDDA